MQNFFISEKIENFLKAEKLPTPFLVVDLDVVSENYKILKDTFSKFFRFGWGGFAPPDALP